MSQVNWNYFNEIHNYFINYLVCASIIEMFWTNEVQTFINDGIFRNVEHLFFHRNSYLRANQGLMLMGKKLFSRKLYNLNMSKDDTKHTFFDIPNNILDKCAKKFIQRGTMEDIKLAENWFMLSFKRKLLFNYLNIHIHHCTSHVH